MKHTSKKLAFLLLCLGILLTSCGDRNDTADTDTTAADTQITDTAAAATAAESEAPVEYAPLLKIGDYTVYEDEFNYYYINYKYEFDGGDDTYWENNPGAEELLNQYVTGALRSNYAIFALAEENGVTLDEADEADIEATFAEMQTYYGGAEELAVAFETYALTERCYREILKASILESKLYTHLSESGAIAPTEEDVRADLEANYVRVLHVLITNDEGDDPEANLQLANDILVRADAGEDFMSLVEQYGEDPGMVDNPDGYYFTYDQMIKEFEDAAFELMENEISGIVEVSSYYEGYHIIKRVPMEEEYIAAHLDEFRAVLATNIFYNMLEERALAFELTVVE